MRRVKVYNDIITKTNIVLSHHYNNDEYKSVWTNARVRGHVEWKQKSDTDTDKGVWTRWVLVCRRWICGDDGVGTTGFCLRITDVNFDLFRNIELRIVRFLGYTYLRIDRLK